LNNVVIEDSMKLKFKILQKLRHALGVVGKAFNESKIMDTPTLSESNFMDMIL
jgi:hypothetical protein